MASDVHDGTSGVLQLDGELTIAQAAAVRERLLAWLPQGDSAIDASRVDACDSTGVQLLLALRRTLQERRQTFDLQAPSAPLREVLQRYGLQDLFFTQP
jgi:anti-anti-sigma factor